MNQTGEILKHISNRIRNNFLQNGFIYISISDFSLKLEWDQLNR